MPIDGQVTSPTGVWDGSMNTRFHRLYNNAHFDYLTETLPKDVKDYFRYAELIYSNTPIVVNGIRKLVNYPLTNFTYETESDKIKKETEKFLIQTLDIRSYLINLGLDYYIYGNAFRNIYFPFERFLVCTYPGCGSEISIDHAKYTMKKGNFVLSCAECGNTRVSKVNDRQTHNINDIRLVSWNPRSMELFSNPITNDTEYYFTLPDQIVKGILSSNHIICSKTPLVFIDAFKEKRVVKFSSNFYHIKTGTLTGLSTGWGISPLVHVLKSYMHMAILKKASEAIALEHIVPQRILFPQANTNDPTIMTSMKRWREEIQTSIRKWRMDPNYIMSAPYPTGVVNIGSQGRQLMPTAEIKQLEEEMLRALDIPPEFVYGSTNINNSTVALRVLENQLEPLVGQLKDHVNWIIRTVNSKFNKNLCEVDFTPFKLSDEIMQKQFYFQMAQQGQLSKSSLQEMMNIDPFDEDEKIKQDQIRAMHQQKELEKAQREMEENIAAQTQQQVQADQQGTVPQYDQQKLIAAAQMKAYELLQVPYEERRSLLAQLSNEDYVMYSLVSSLMGQMREGMEKEQQPAV